ncbi:NACHT domain-containing protein [Mucilaginibacter sp.]|uniref:NACHT domain-containing protein n=1 Tax=Mucilaginibacter sp. TaxID=1882438 RepID=UPI003266C98D
MDDIIKTTIEAFIKIYVADARNLFEDLFDSGKQFLEIGLKKYLIKCENRYSKVKTLLHGNTPVKLYSIYHHFNIFIDKSQFYSTKNISNIFAPRKNCVTIIGEAGSGKSTLIKHLFLNCIATNFGIPILLELRHLNEFEGNIEEALFKILLKEDIVVNHDVIDALLQKGKFVFFLDGFDEIPSRLKDEAIKSLTDFINKYESNKYLLTTRPHADAEHLQRFYNHRIGKLDAISDMSAFIRKQLSVDEDGRDIAEKIIESITKSEHKYIFSFLTNPLLLSIYILTFQTNALIPAKKHIFYERVIIALFSEHDSRSKLTFTRERLSNLTQEQIEDLLGLFCLYSFFENKYDWDKGYVRDKFRSIKKMSFTKEAQFDVDKLIKDLTTGLSLWTEDSGILSFAHRTLQEYYTARLVKNLKSDEKINFYQLLISKYVKKSDHPYLLSLLGFLLEMDTFSYKKHFMLPILKEVEQHFETFDEETFAVQCLDYFGYNIFKHPGSSVSQNIIPLGKYVPIIGKLNQSLKEVTSRLQKPMLNNNSFDSSNIIIPENTHSSKDLTDKRKDLNIDIESSNWDIFQNFLEIEDDDEYEKQQLLKSKTSSEFWKRDKITKKRGEALDRYIRKTVQVFVSDLRFQISEIEDYIKATEEDESKIISIFSSISNANRGYLDS